MTTKTGIVSLPTLAASAVVILLSMSSCHEENEWTPLLDRDLSRWEMYLGYKHTPDYKGEVPRDEKGDAVQPVGYNKNVDSAFVVAEEHGEPVLRIRGEIYGCVFTKQEFENYDLKLKVKWGDRKWDPRTDKLNDSGVLYHSIGKCGVDYWRAWMLSQEFQIMEGHMGDYWNIAGSATDVRALIPEGKMCAVASGKQPFLAIGEGTGRDGFCLRSEDRESPRGEWTDIELICFGDKSLHIVNGQVVMILQNSRYTDGGKSLPLVKGRIQLQSEATEVLYKDMKIRSIKAMPAEYSSYFN
jgi:hypothetical protein